MARRSFSSNEIRSLAIAFFYARGTLAGGVAAPALFSRLIETHERMNIFCGYLVAGVLARCGARSIPRGTVLELRIGVSAERRSLEEGQTAAWPSITLSMRCSYLPSEPCSFTSLL